MGVTEEKRKMKENVLLPRGGLLHGCDYNPEQWMDHPEILREDIRMMKETGINCVTLGVFSWSVYEPGEGEFHVQWLLDIMDALYENGIYTVLATPTGAKPRWLDLTYPEALRVEKNGVRRRPGLRHNHCLSAPAFRSRAEWIIRHIAEAVKDHPGLILWHISNELSGECFCPHCQQAFREYLRRKFDGKIENLNRAWWTAFWSRTYGSFSEVEPPFENGETCINGLNLAWREFTSENFVRYVRFERGILREVTPDVPVTTNFMHRYPLIDYHEMAKELDLVSWDSYPPFHNDCEDFSETAAANSFDHALIRGTKPGVPFLMMESTPSLVNWMPFNKLKRPGVHRLSGLAAVALGSDSVQYFQWRKGRGSCEQFHGAVVDHLGTDDTRVIREVAELGADLRRLAGVAGSAPEAKAAVLFDWSTRWALADMQAMSRERIRYEETCCLQYESLLRLGVETDVVSPEAELSGYSLVIAPMLYLLKPGRAAHLAEYVKNGGRLIATYALGYVNETALCWIGGFPGDGLGELFGVVSEEMDTLYPSDRNIAVFKDGERFEIRDFCEILRVRDAGILASYTSDFYGGTPVVTRKDSGKGCAYYVAARISQEGMEKLYGDCLAEAGVPVERLPAGVERHVRTDGADTYTFWLNNTDQERVVEKAGSGTELLSGDPVRGTLCLAPWGAGVVKKKK